MAGKPKDNEQVDLEDDDVEYDITEDDLDTVGDLKPEPETVRDTINRTLKESEVAELKASGGTLIAPADWDDEGKKYFGSLTDRKHQEFILNRHKTSSEAMKKVTDEFGAYRTAWDPIAKIMEPYIEVLREAKQTPASVIQRYINAELYLNKEPVNAIRWFMQKYKVTPEMLVAAAKEPLPGDGGKKTVQLDPNDPKDAILIGLQKESQERKQRDQRAVEQQNENNKTQITEAMKSLVEEKDTAGNLKYPHSNDPEIRKLMGTYITTGIVDIQKAGGLLPAFKAAYDMAVNTHVPTRETAFKARMDAEAAKKVTEDKRKTDKARRLGSSLSGGGSSGTVQTQKKGQSVGESLRKTAAAIGYGTQT